MEFCSAGNAVSLAVDAGYMGMFPIIYRKNVCVCGWVGGCTHK